MSAYVKEYPYVFGKKKPDAPEKEPIITKEKLEAFKRALQKSAPRK